MGCVRLLFVKYAYKTCGSSIVRKLAIRHACFSFFFSSFLSWSHDRHVIRRKSEWMSRRLDAYVNGNFTRKWNRPTSRNQLCMYIWVWCFKMKWRGVALCIHSTVWNVVRGGDKLWSVPTVVMMKLCTFWSLEEFMHHKPSPCHGDLFLLFFCRSSIWWPSLNRRPMRRQKK